MHISTTYKGRKQDVVLTDLYTSANSFSLISEISAPAAKALPLPVITIDPIRSFSFNAVEA